MSQTAKLLATLAAALLPGAALADQVGIASWYGGHHDGRRTSSGEIFDQEGLTAASRSIPLGTRIRVTMQDTGQSVVVKVNDRMGGRGSILDLSKGAAREIGLLGRGRGLVSIASAAGEPVEVAEAFDEDTADLSDSPAPLRRRGRAGRAHAHVHARFRSGRAAVVLVHGPITHRAAKHARRA